MIFSVVVSHAPKQPQKNTTLKFCQALLQQGHQLYRVFFMGEGVRAGTSAAQDHEAWASLQSTHNIDLVACVTDFQARFEAQDCGNAFALSGMAQLADASHHSDRVVTFK